MAQFRCICCLEEQWHSGCLGSFRLRRHSTCWITQRKDDLFYFASVCGLEDRWHCGGLHNVQTIYSASAAFAALSDGTVVAWGHADGGGIAPNGLNNMQVVYGSTMFRSISTSPHSYTLERKADPGTVAPAPTLSPTQVPKIQCAGGMYVKNKNSAYEMCESCPAGRFSKESTRRNRKCKKCKRNTYQNMTGSTKATLPISANGVSWNILWNTSTSGTIDTWGNGGGSSITNGSGIGDNNYVWAATSLPS